MRVAFWKRDSGVRAGSKEGDGLPVLSQYVGRAEELARFEEVLRDEQKVVVNVSGQYGLGKTELLRRFQQSAAAGGLITASTDTTAKGMPAMLASLADQLAERGRPARRFTERYRTYRQRLTELEADPKAPKALAALAAGTFAKGGVRAARHLPVAGLAFELVPEDVAATAASELTNYVIAKVGNKDEVELVLEPVPTLTRLFLRDLRGVAEPHGAALFLDADDTSYRDVGSWLLDVLKERYGAPPDDLLVVIASPRELDRGDWVSFEARLERISLGPLTEDEARRYLEQAGVTNEAVIAEILRRSGRIPLSLAVLAAQRPETPEQVGDPNGTAVEGFLSSVAEPVRRRLAVDGSVPRVVNRDVLGIVVGKDDVLDDFVWLTGLPFLKDTEHGWVYSEPVREQLLQRSRRDAPQSWTRLQRKLAGYYEELAAGLTLDEDEQASDTEWQAHELEATYHGLCGGARAARRRVLNGFVAAFAADRRFAERYATAIRQAGTDCGYDWLSELGDVLAAGTAAVDTSDSPRTLEMFQMLLDSGDLEDPWRAKALDWRGFITMVQGELEAALEDFDAALELEPNSVEYRLDRARALQGIGRYDEALRDLDRAESIEPDNPIVLILRAQTYQLANRLDEALADVERVLELQPTNASAWMLKADVLQVKQELDEALASLDHALELEPDKPRAWAAHGRVQQARGRLEEAVHDLDQARRLAPDDYGILSLRANLLGRSGKLDEAKQAIRELIERAPQFFEEYGAILSALPREEFQRRSSLFAGMAGLDDREAARQIESFAGGAERVVKVLQADLAVIEAQAHLKAEDVDAAIADYGRALECDPARPSLWTGRAGLLLRVERLDEALGDTEKAIELAPDEYGPVGIRWGILAKKGDLAGAAAAARTVADHADEYVRQLSQTARLLAAAARPSGDGARSESSIGAGGQAWLDLAATDPEAAARAVRVEAGATEAAALLSEGDLSGAVACYGRALELDPEHSGIWTAKAELEQRLGNVDEARTAFDRAVASGPENAQARASRALFHLSQGNLDQALADVERARAIAPEEYTFVSTQAVIFREKGDLDGSAAVARILAEHAEEYVEQTAARARIAAAVGAPTSIGDGTANPLALFLEDPDAAVRQVRAEGPMAEALLLRSQGDLDGAVAAWTRALEIGGPRAEWLIERGEARRLAGHLEEALADFDSAIALDDDSAEAHGSRGQVLRALDRPEEALLEFDRAVELDDSLLWVYLERGELHRLGERFEPALADFDRMLELAPESAIAHGSRGQVLRALGRLDEALVALDRALELDETLLWARLERGELHLDAARWKAAEADFSRLLEAGPSSAAALAGRGRALLALGRFDDALADLDRAIEEEPEVAFSYGVRGEIRSMLRDTEGALADFARANELTDAWPWAQSRLSETLQLVGRQEEALAASEAAVKTAPDDAWMLYVRALARESLGHVDAARQDLDAAIEIDEQAAESLGDAPAHLLNAALYRLARGARGDVEKAKRLFRDVAPTDASHRRDLIRDLETLSLLRENETAATLADTLASQEDAGRRARPRGRGTRKTKRSRTA